VDPGFAPAYTYLGRTYYRNHHFDEARAALETAIRLNPAQVRANNFLAVLLRRQAMSCFYRGENNLGSQLLKQALDFHGRARGIIDLERLDFPWAENSLNWTIAECVRFDPTIPLPYSVKEALSRAKNAFENKIASSNKLDVFLFTMARLNLELGHYDKAKSEFQECLNLLEKRLSRDSKGLAERGAEVHYHLGVTELKLYGISAKGEAIKHFQAAVSAIAAGWSESGVARALDGQYWYDDRVELGAEKATVRQLAPFKPAPIP